MKRLFALVAATLFAATIYAADQLPLFNATLTVGKDHRFILVSQPEGKTSGWLKLGETFDGYTLKDYDAKANTLGVERDGKVSRLSIVADAATGSAAMQATPATLADAEAVMNKIHIDDLLARTLGQQKKMFAGQINSIGQRFPNADPADVAAFKEKLMGEFESALNVGQLKSDLARIYSETFTKEQLEQISSFYDTPLGQLIQSKQPEIQEKVQASVVPRMTELAPKIQAMARDFAAEQKAKASAAAGAPAPAPVPKP